MIAREDGPHEAATLLLIHGTAASLHSWDPLVPLLTDTRHVVRVDLPGFGTIVEQAKLVGAELDQLGVEQTTVVGHSSGGCVATALAEDRPDLATALALISTGPDMAAYTGEAITVTPREWPDLTDDQLRQIMSNAFAPGYQIPQPLLDEARGMDLMAFAAMSQAIRAYLDERSLPNRLAPLGKPLLVLFGAEDRRWRPSSAADYHAVPGARVELLPGVGHSPNIEDPARTAALLLAFQL
ncbi:MAG TPA: alpha/beta fold hydrolase [Pseudonocardiaceae bacterium]